MLIAGVDEVGRGCLAGVVVAAAVILNDAAPIAGLADSKKLTARARERLTVEIKSRALHWAIAEASVHEIDEHNILRASLLAMQRAVAALAIAPNEVWADGNIAPKVPMPCKTFIGGDATHACISAASIIAKTHRDALMVGLDAHHPQYGFAQHKGYGTAAHLRALNTFGAIHDIHRASFAPVRQSGFRRT